MGMHSGAGLPRSLLSLRVSGGAAATESSSKRFGTGGILGPWLAGSSRAAEAVLGS